MSKTYGYATNTGFVWGNAEVGRMFCESNGRRFIQVVTPREELMIYITPSGLIRHWTTKTKKDNK